MKIKGVTIIERHVEKGVLLFFGLFFVAVLAMQLGLLGGARSVKVGGRDVPLDQADAALRSMAEVKRAALESTAVVAGVPDTDAIPSARDQFLAALQSKGSPRTLASLGTPAFLGSSSAGGEIQAIEAATAPFALFEPPAPDRPVAAPFGAAIDPLTVAEIGPELAKLLPPAQPFDLRFVSVQSGFDAAKLREILGAPAPEGSRAIPEALWKSLVEILDVQWFRQERLADGSWSEESPLALMPGAPDTRAPLVAPDLGPSSLRGIVEQERTAREFIRRPPFYPTVSGDPWELPAKALGIESENADKQRQLEAALRVLKGYESEVDRLRRQLKLPPADRGAPPPPPERRSSRDATPLAPDEFVWPRLERNYLAQIGGGGGGGGPEEPKQPRERDTGPLQEALRKAEADEAKQVEALRVLGFTRFGQPLAAASFAEPLHSVSHPDAGQFTLWTHDLTARPGATYRYRARVRVTNPLFGQTDGLVDEQKSLAQNIAIDGAFSEWSDPIVLPEERVLILQAASEPSTTGLASPARASVELFEFYYGYWRRVEVGLEPGDTAAGTITLPEGLVTYEITTDESGRRSIAQQTPVERNRPLQMDTFLLGVASAWSKDKAIAQAAFAQGADRILLRVPSNDPSTAALREALAKSARSAERGVARLPGSSPWGGPPAPGGGGDPAGGGPSPLGGNPLGGNPLGGGQPGQPGGLPKPGGF